MSYSKCQNIWKHIKHFFQLIWMILLCTNFQCTLMLVGGCNLAQLIAWAYRAMYFNCPALQAVHYFFKNDNLLRSYT